MSGMPQQGLPMNLPPGVTPQLLHSLGINEGPITNQVFVANVSVSLFVSMSSGPMVFMIRHSLSFCVYYC